MGHTGLESEGSGKVDGLLGVILYCEPTMSLLLAKSSTYLREGLHLSSKSGGSLLGQVGERSGSGFLILSVRHLLSRGMKGR